MRSFVALNLAFSIVLDDATDADSDGNALSIVFDESTNTDREDIVFLFCEKCGTQCVRQSKNELSKLFSDIGGPHGIAKSYRCRLFTPEVTRPCTNVQRVATPTPRLSSAHSAEAGGADIFSGRT